MRGVEELVVREAERREQEGHQERGRRPGVDQFVAQNVRRRREGTGYGGPVEFILVRGEKEGFSRRWRREMYLFICFRSTKKRNKINWNNHIVM